MRRILFSVLLTALLAASSLACKPSTPATDNTSDPPRCYPTHSKTPPPFDSTRDYRTHPLNKKHLRAKKKQNPSAIRN